MTPLALALALLLEAAPAAAVAAPSTPAPPLAIMGARVELGDGTGLANASVIVVDGKIAEVGVGLSPPRGAQVIDGRGKVLTPGLIATGSQVGLVEVGLERGTVDASLEGAAVPAFRAIDGFNPRSWRVAIDRGQGVTSSVLTPWGALIHGQGFVVELSGEPDSPAHAKRVAMFGALAGGARDAAGGSRGGVLLRLREILDDVRFYRANKSAYDRAQTRPLALSRLHLEAMFDVVDGKLPFVIDANRESDLRALLALADEQRLRVVVNGGAEAWLVAKELAARKVPVILQPTTMEPWGFDALHARDDAAALLDEAGVPLILSSGGTDNGTTRLRQEAGVAVAYGLPWRKALTAITLAPSRAFGVDGELGTIAKGKRADLVLWSGDPFEVSSAADVVIIGGRRQDMGSRQRALAERYRAAH
ncbi:MAG: amidohydrolase family protein [Deltaproteobacteria bacterium]|nr:amidohydrolase family protein [Deltaproteobacteria bacterium]